MTAAAQPPNPDGRSSSMARDPVCGMSVDPARAPARRTFGGREFFFCAPGCAAKFDTDPAGFAAGRRRPEAMAPPRRSPAKGGGLPLFAGSAPSPAPPSPRPKVARAAPDPSDRMSLAVEGMHCASCVNAIETALAAVPGVREASVNLTTGRAEVRGESLDARRLTDAVRESGYEARLAPAEGGEGEDARRAQREERALLRRTVTSAALTLPVFALSMAELRFPGRDFVLLALTLPVYLWAGSPFLVGAIRTLRRRTAHMDTLVAPGTTAALRL